MIVVHFRDAIVMSTPKKTYGEGRFFFLLSPLNGLRKRLRKDASKTARLQRVKTKHEF